MSETRSCKIQTWQILLAWAPSLPLLLGQAGDAPSGAHPSPWAMAAPFPAQQLLGYQGMSFTCVFWLSDPLLILSCSLQRGVSCSPTIFPHPRKNQFGDQKAGVGVPCLHSAVSGRRFIPPPAAPLFQQSDFN